MLYHSIMYYTIVVCLLLASTLPTSEGYYRTASLPTPHQEDSRKLQMQEERRARVRKNFEPGRDLLWRKGVPFDPEELLEPNWQRRLAPKFAEISEMQLVRRLGRRFKGVQLADVLYLPEKVELTGDTIIIANKVIFEGQHAVIKGNYNVYFFPVETGGVLGTTLEAASKEQGLRFSTVSFNGSSAAKRFAPRLLQDGWSITIDTSGRGRKEWLEEQNKARRVNFKKASLQGDTVDTSGQAGSTGPTGQQGPPTNNGSQDPFSGRR